MQIALLYELLSCKQQYLFSINQLLPILSVPDCFSFLWLIQSCKGLRHQKAMWYVWVNYHLILLVYTETYFCGWSQSPVYVTVVSSSSSIYNLSSSLDLDNSSQVLLGISKAHWSQNKLEASSDTPMQTIHKAISAHFLTYWCRNTWILGGQKAQTEDPNYSPKLSGYLTSFFLGVKQDKVSQHLPVFSGYIELIVQSFSFS